MSSAKQTPNPLARKAPPLSAYFDSRLYASLLEIQSRGRGIPDAGEVSDAVHDLLRLEARLLDENRFEEWIDLFREECVYWVPGEYPPENPENTVSITLDDRRRIEDRIVRYRTGFAFSQLPLSRTSRCLSRPECWWVKKPGEVLARTAFQLSELRRGETNHYAGYLEHLINFSEKSPLIEQKRVHLIMADQILKNISFIF